MQRTIFFWIILVFAGWSCEKEAAMADSGNSSSQGGSLARFAISGNALYLVDDYGLKVMDITNPNSFEQKKSINLGWGIETIFPYKNRLFIGSQTGMYVYDITQPFDPKELGQAHHMRSCDPVVANDTIAFITLRGGNACGPATDGVYVYDVKEGFLNLKMLQLFKLGTPYGLGLNGNILYVCRGFSGLEILNVSDPDNIRSVKNLALKSKTVKDVIVDGNLLIVYTNKGISLYDITRADAPELITNIEA